MNRGARPDAIALVPERTWVVFMLAAQLQVPAQNWQQLADFPGTARDDAASFTIGDRIYVGTGMDAGFQLTDDWWCFDRMTEQWSSVASLPASARQYCTGFTIADTGYIFGGVDANGALNELWAYHPASDAWEQKASLPAEARYACVAVTGFYWNAIVATGMLASGIPTKEAWKYDAPSDSWTMMAPVPGPSRHRASCFLGAGGMVIAGGADSTFAPLSDVWSYPIWFETGEWYPEAPLPAPRFAADGSWGNAQTIVGGADGPGPSDVHADAWRWDETTWHALPPFPGGPRRGAISASGTDTPWTGTIYYGTGSDNVQRHNDWWKLEFPTGMDEEGAHGITIAPVPANNAMRVIIPAGAWSEWRIIALDSRPVMRGPIRDTTTELHTAALPDGSYVLCLTGPRGAVRRPFQVLL